MRLYLNLLFFILFSTEICAYHGGFKPSFSDWGGVGLLQTPTARFYEDGSVSFGPTRSYPYTLVNLNMQFLPWLETSLRYVIKDDPEGSCVKSRDRSMDLKFLLLSEGEYWPQMALGFQDAFGTSCHRSEFLAFSKRYYDLDFTFGVGWGQLGTKAHTRNVFGCVNKHFKERRSHQSEKLSLTGYRDFFRGEHIAFFGGVEYSTPVEGLNLKIEYNSNSMEKERLSHSYRYGTAFNFGASYQLTDWFELRAGVEQGRHFMIGGSLMGNFHERPPHPVPPIPPVKVRGQPIPGMPTAEEGAKPQTPPPLHVVATALFEKAGMPLVALYMNKPTLWIYCENKQYRLPAVAIARIARILTFIAPDEIDCFKIILVEKGMNLTSATIIRRDIEVMGTTKSSPEEVAPHVDFAPVSSCYPQGTYVNPKFYPHYSPYIVPRFKQTLFDANSGIQFQVILAGGVKAEFAPGLLGSAEIGINVYDGLEDIRPTGTGKLPRVRSDIRRYAHEGRYHLAHLQFDKITQLSPNLFTRLSSGFFEAMFAGYSGEILYRPYSAPCAIGLEVNHVHQRDFKQLFCFRDYQVTTGHVSFYTDLPFWNLHTNIHVGRYLAKDWGSTIELSRRFETGFEVGFFTTRTTAAHDNVDKGVWFKIPLDFILGGHQKKGFDYMLRPLSKDAGQRVSVNNRLYAYVRDHSAPELKSQMRHFGD